MHATVERFNLANIVEYNIPPNVLSPIVLVDKHIPNNNAFNRFGDVEYANSIPVTTINISQMATRVYCGNCQKTFTVDVTLPLSS